MRMDAETRTFFETLMKADVRPEQENLKLLILDQLKTLRNKSGRCVWHTAVLDWCTDVYRSNPGAYQHMSLGGFLKLPDKDTCRKRAARVQATSGESRELMESLKKRVSAFPPHRREMALLFDEITPCSSAVNLKPPSARQEISRLREVDILCESNLQY